MDYTQNLNLPQFAETDRIHHDDFNDAFAAIDTAVAAAGNCRIVTGSYVGTGTYGASNARTLTFGFVPKIVFIVNTNAVCQEYRAIFVHGCTSAQSSDYMAYGIQNVYWDDDARTMTWYSTEANNGVSAMMNRSGTTYLYVALG